MGLDLRSARERGFEKLVLALRAYRAAYGDCNVPSGFVVPSDAPWPRACWAMPLGNPRPRPLVTLALALSLSLSLSLSLTLTLALPYPGNRVNALRSKRSYLKGRPEREARPEQP